MSKKTGYEICCENCGIKFYKPKCRITKQNFCTDECRKKFLPDRVKEYHFKKQNNSKPRRKYVRIGKKRIAEHRLVMQKHLRRKLEKWEHVHHINNDPSDNRLDNLVVISNSLHSKITISENPHIWKS